MLNERLILQLFKLAKHKDWKEGKTASLLCRSSFLDSGVCLD